MDQAKVDKAFLKFKENIEAITMGMTLDENMPELSHELADVLPVDLLFGKFTFNKQDLGKKIKVNVFNPTSKNTPELRNEVADVLPAASHNSKSIAKKNYFNKEVRIILKRVDDVPKSKKKKY